jgi:hypothetical protein
VDNSFTGFSFASRPLQFLFSTPSCTGVYFSMNRKFLIYLFLSIGSIAGGWIPTLWGASAFSFQSILGSFIGGLLGIWAGYKLGE